MYNGPMEPILGTALAAGAALAGVASTYGIMRARIDALEAELHALRRGTLPELEKRLRATERSLAKFSGPHSSAGFIFFAGCATLAL